MNIYLFSAQSFDLKNIMDQLNYKIALADITQVKINSSL